MHDDAVVGVSSQNVGYNFAECRGEQTLVDVGNGSVHVVLRGGHSTALVAMLISHDDFAKFPATRVRTKVNVYFSTSFKVAGNIFQDIRSTLSTKVQVTQNWGAKSNQKETLVFMEARKSCRRSIPPKHEEISPKQLTTASIESYATSSKKIAMTSRKP
jgi:hypothetical protein